MFLYADGENGDSFVCGFYQYTSGQWKKVADLATVSKGGKLKRESSYGTYKSIYSYGKNTRTFYAAKKLPAFQNSNGTKQVFTVKKGGKVKILKCRLTGGKMYIQIKYGNRKGWIKASTNYNSRLFTNVTYAG